jgi:hypothetical protein
MHVGYWWESQKGRNNYEDQILCGWIILRLILERYDGVVWAGLVWLRIESGGGLL